VQAGAALCRQGARHVCDMEEYGVCCVICLNVEWPACIVCASMYMVCLQETFVSISVLPVCACHCVRKGAWVWVCAGRRARVGVCGVGGVMGLGIRPPVAAVSLACLHVKSAEHKVPPEAEQT